MEVDNIHNKVLDKLKKLYSDQKGFRVLDDREALSFGKKREYFLISYENIDTNDIRPSFTFIWIGKNLWQYRYLNIHCKKNSLWLKPSKLLNTLLNNKF